MKPLKIRYLGDPVLAAKAKPVDVVDDTVRELSAQMIQLMYKSNGIGLAGNQVGFPIRLVVIHADPPEDEEGNPLPVTTDGERLLYPRMPLTLINPEIVSFSEEKCSFNEGCLSVPKLYADVIRSSKVVLKSKLLDGSEILLECGGLLARVVQHELDHLEGVVFVEKAEEESYGLIRAKVEKQIKKNGWKNFKVRRPV